MVIQRKSLEPLIPDEVVYYNHQIEGIRELSKRKSFLLADEMGLGKANPYSEPILTPTGWTEMGKLYVGDQVIGSSGQATDVIGIFEQGIKEIVKVTFSDGGWTKCTWDHLWNVQSANDKFIGKGYKTLTARQILNSGLRDAAGNCRHYIPMVRPVEFDPSLVDDQTIDPYTLGVLLGDGSMSHSSVQLATDYKIAENLRLPRNVLLNCLDDSHEYCGKYELPEMYRYLRPLGLMGTKSETKFIPNQYKWGSVFDRIAVLQGLIDTDGTPVQSRGQASTTIEYGTVSKQLSEDVKFIVQSLGGTVSIHEKIPTYSYKGETGLKGQLFYRMTLRLPSWIVPFKLERKLERWTPRSKYEPTRSIVSIESDGEEEARCIKVSAINHLYVTRNFIVTHNSLSAITIFAIDVYRKWVETALIVCPVTLKENWYDEFQKFTCIPCIILEGTPVQRKKILQDFEDLEGPRVLVCNYEQVAAHQVELRELHFDVGIFDEAHYLKNPKAKRTKACFDLKFDRTFLLTGTPMLNQVNELWAPLHMINPRRFPKYWSFVNRFCVWGGYQDRQIIGVKNEKELTEILQEYMVRRLKKDVLDLPEVQIIERKISLLPEQIKIYEEVRDEMRLERINADEPDDIENALTKFLRLKQICGTTHPFTGEDYSSKLDLAVNDAIELLANGNKIVVFTQFRDVLERFCVRLDTRAPQFDIWELHGGIKQDKRQPTVKDWSASTQPGALVCMLQIAGVGLNMTAARNALFLDELFVPGLNQQAIDRLHRIGQSYSQPVQVHKYICKGTIENRVQEILRQKNKIFGNIVESDPNWRKKLLEALLEEDD